MRIVFMGSPDFAVPSLDILVKNGYDVVAVITATDKYGGRGGKKLLKTPVKVYAEENNIPVLQPKNLKASEFIEELASYKADVQIVVAFRMLPVVVWDMPQHGTYNLHGSLLPKYRGAAPINWAVVRGEKETGVTSFKLKHAIDTGDFLFQRKIKIGEDETAGELYERMRFLGADVIHDTLKAIETGELNLIPQDDSEATSAPKIYKETCEINWKQDVSTVYNFIRGMSPFPTAWTTLDGLQFQITKCKKKESDQALSPGQVVIERTKKMKISCANGYIILEEVKLQGKRKMTVVDFLNGYKETTWEIGMKDDK